MVAANRYNASDSIKKYGWLIMPYLSNLGVSLLTEASILFVDVNHAEASDVEDERHGHTINFPLASIDYAIGLCTADKGDIILVAPGHTETISGEAGIDLDVDDVTILGLGVRSKRPIISFSAAASTFEINADNVTVKNLQFVPTYSGEVTAGIDVKGGSEYVTLEGCRFYETADTKRFNICITLEDEVDFFTARDCEFTNLAQGGNDSALYVEDDADYIVVEDCTFIGDYTTACLDLDAGAINYPLIRNCLIVNLDSSAGLAITTNSATVAIYVDLRVATAKGTYPVSDSSATFEINCHGGEAGAITYAGLVSKTPADYSG